MGRLRDRSDRYRGPGLTPWFPPFAALLLLIGLPICLATAFVQEGGPSVSPRDPTLVPRREPVPAEARSPAGAKRIFTWRNAILGGVLALEAEYRKALELNPNEPEGIEQYAQFQLRAGKGTEGLPLAVNAYELDPLSYVYATVAAFAYHAAGDHVAEAKAIETALAFDNAGFAYLGALSLSLAHNDPETAARMTIAAVNLNPRYFAPIGGAVEGLKPLVHDRERALTFLRNAYGEFAKGEDVGGVKVFWTWALFNRDYDIAAEALRLSWERQTFDGLFVWISATPGCSKAGRSAIFSPIRRECSIIGNTAASRKAAG